MINHIENYLNWTRATTKSIRENFPSRHLALALKSTAEESYAHSIRAGQSILGADDFGVEAHDLIEALKEESRYLAVMLGSRLFDHEVGAAHVYTGDISESSLFGIGLGWLPLSVMLGCDIDASIRNANHVGEFSSVVPSLHYTVTLGSTAASILSLDDIKLVAIKQIEENALCSEEELVDYLNKVSVSHWDFAIAETGDSLLMMEG